MLTKSGFIALIADAFSDDITELNSYTDGTSEKASDITARMQEFRKSGWIEEQDILGQNEEVDRRTAARIIHMFMRNVLGIRDMEDITPAYQMKDLFDCRVCAGHIAEVYMRGIIPAVELSGMKIFDVYRNVTEKEAEAMITALRKNVAELEEK